MADALSDIVTLAGAFGSFTQSLATLHDTKVRVEKGLRAAQIERANNDFLQRFNLAYDDPNHLDAENWMDALVDHESNLEGFLVQTRGGKAVDAEVRAELMPITEGFTTAVGNKMIESTKALTQAKFGVMVDELLAAGKSAEEIRARTKREIDAGILDPERTRAFEVSLQKLEGSELASIVMASTKLDALAGTERQITPSEAMAKAGSNDGRFAGLNKVQEAAYKDSINAWQAAEDKDAKEKIDYYSKARKDQTMTESMRLSFGDFLKSKEGRLSSFEAMSLADEYMASVATATLVDLELYASSVIGAYPDGIPLNVAKNAAATLRSKMKTQPGTEVLADEEQKQLDRIQSHTISVTQSTDKIEAEFRNEVIKQKELSKTGNASMYDVANALNNYLRAGMEHGFAADIFFEDQKRELENDGGYNSDYGEVIKNGESLFREVAISNGVSEKDIKAIIANEKSGSKLTPDQMALKSVMGDVGRALASRLRMPGSAGMSYSEQAKVYKELASAAIVTKDLGILPLKEGIFKTPYLKALSVSAGMRESGGLADQLYGDDINNRPEEAVSVFRANTVDDAYNLELRALDSAGLLGTKGLAGLKEIRVRTDRYYAGDGVVYDLSPSKTGPGLQISVAIYDKSKAPVDSKLEDLDYKPISIKGEIEKLYKEKSVKQEERAGFTKSTDEWRVKASESAINALDSRISALEKIRKETGAK